MFLHYSIVLMLVITPIGLAPKAHSYFFSSLEFAYLRGSIFATNDFVRGKNAARTKINTFRAYALKLSKQTQGEKTWQRLYNYPSYGLGLLFGDMNNSKEVGYPISLYIFFRGPFVRGPKWVLNYESGWGITTNFKPYHAQNNPYNEAIGSRETLMATFSLILQYQLTKYLDLSTSFTLTHFSNAALKNPNLGINTFAPRLSLRYHLQAKPQTPGKSRESLNYKPYEWLISTLVALKDVPLGTATTSFSQYNSLKFLILGLKLRLNRQISNKSKFGIATDLTYNGNSHKIIVQNGNLQPVRLDLKDKLSNSLFLSYELVINNLAFLIQYGAYLYRHEVDAGKPGTYQRIGLRYHFTHHLFVAMTLKAYHFSVADFIGWNIGYRL